MQNLKKSHAKIELVLISDIDVNISWGKSQGYETWMCPDYMTDEKIGPQKNIWDLTFRNGFWFHTYSRFYAIADYMSLNEGPILHVEGDVILLPNFPFEKIANLTKLAYPLENKNIGVASTLFFPDYKSALKLKKFTIESAKKVTNSTDMTILAEYASEFRGEIEVLPNAAPDSGFYSELTSEKTIELLAENYPKFGGIFDGAAYGQYYGGVDHRINSGARKIFSSVDRGEGVAPSKLSFHSENKSMFLSSQKTTVEIFTLHIHSKDLRLFNPEKFWDVLQKREKKQQFGEYTEIVRFEFYIKRILKFTFGEILRLIGSDQNKIIGKFVENTVLIVAKFFRINALPRRVRKIIDLTQPTNPLENRNSPAINLAIPCHSKDFQMLPKVLHGAKSTILNPIKRIYLITPARFAMKLQNDFPECEVLTDENVLGPEVISLIKDLVPKERQGWVSQQVIKFKIVMQSDVGATLILDADTILLSPKTWLDEEGRQVLCVSNEFHTPYKSHQRLMFGGQNCLLSFVTHHQLMQNRYLKEMFGNSGENLIKWLMLADFDEDSGLSEYDSYGEYVYSKKRAELVLSKWNNKFINKDLTDIDYLEIKSKYKDFCSISCHAYL